MHARTHAHTHTHTHTHARTRAHAHTHTLQKWKNSPALHQLCLSDHADLRKCYLSEGCGPAPYGHCRSVLPPIRSVRAAAHRPIAEGAVLLIVAWPTLRRYQLAQTNGVGFFKHILLLSVSE